MYLLAVAVAKQLAKLFELNDAIGRLLMRVADMKALKKYSRHAQGQVIVSDVPHGEGPGQQTNVPETDSGLVLKLHQFLFSIGGDGCFVNITTRSHS